MPIPDEFFINAIETEVDFNWPELRQYKKMIYTVMKTCENMNDRQGYVSMYNLYQNLKFRGLDAIHDVKKNTVYKVM